MLRLRSVQFENMGRYAEALASAREGLALFGVRVPDRGEPTRRRRSSARSRRSRHCAARATIAALVELPAHDATRRCACVMSMLTDIWSAAYILGDPTLARLISATMVRLSLEHGNVEESAYGYVTHAITVGPVRGDYAGRLRVRAASRWR